MWPTFHMTADSPPKGDVSDPGDDEPRVMRVCFESVSASPGYRKTLLIDLGAPLNVAATQKRRRKTQPNSARSKVIATT